MSASAEASGKMTRRSIDVWKAVYIIILILAVFTRLIWLGDRAVSHDETTHAKYSWNLYSGRGFRHDPLMHGPLLFEATSLFYFLFGVSDFTARLYTALAGIALVVSPVLLRKWLGQWGALIASLLLLISPAITYYSRYTRHDIPIMLMVILFLWSVFSYLEDGKTRWLTIMAGCFALMYASKENAYIYTAIFLFLLALPFLKWLLTTPWSNPNVLKFLIPLLLIALIAGGLFVLSLGNSQVVEAGEGNNDIGGVIVPGWGRLALLLACTSMTGSLLVVVQGVGRDNFINMRLFDVLMVVGTLTLPLGSALMMKFIAGVDMTQFYSGMMALNFNAMAIGSVIGAFAMLFIMIALSIFLGLWWDRRRWPGIAIVFYTIFFILYSSIFTWGWGMITGLVGGLAYWIAQQDVQRGSQPWYYYGIVGPMYEYLPLLFSLLAAIPAIGWLFRPGTNAETLSKDIRPGERNLDFSQDLSQRYTPIFLLVWALLSWVAYAIAGEKMPWLFVHIAFPHILLAAWGLGRWLKDLTWEDFTQQFGWLVPVSLFFLWMAARAFRKSSGALQTIQQTLASSGASDELGQLLAQLDPLARFIGGIGGVLLCTMLLVWALDRAGIKRALKLVLLSLFIITGGLTVRTMIMLNYINSELAKEFLVYAHATPDVSLALDEIEELSWRLTGTANEIKVAYGKEVAWPFYWYMDTRYPNNYYYEAKPEPDKLLECPIIVAASQEWADVSEITGLDYVHFDYKHIWWPIEDYKDLTWERISNALTDPEMRSALVDIVVDRDYTHYAQLINPENPFTLKTWPNRLEFRLYIRKDLARQVWGYRLGEAGPDAYILDADDAFAAGEVSLPPLRHMTLPQFSGRGLAAANDQTFYVVDSDNHQVLHLSGDGLILHTFGGYGVGPGQFNAPWGVAVDQQGDVYVADTWNHRIQKFDANGQHLLTWGHYGQSPVYNITGQGVFFGPRGIAVGPDNRIYVTDTGNNRVQVFTEDGQYISEFGGTGEEQGFLSEPVGITINAAGEVFVADSWNHRIQVFGLNGIFLRLWEIPSWETEHPDAKPFLAEDERCYLCR